MSGVIWSGGREPFADGPDVTDYGGVTLGRYAGHAAIKNEDGA